MLFISAIAASMDSLFIGYSFRCNHTKFTWYHRLEIFLGLFLTFILFHFLFAFFHVSIANKYLKGVLFFLLGILSLQKKEEKKYSKTLSFKELILLVFSSSVDGFLVSLTFCSSYSIYFLSFLFATIGTLFLEIGNHITFQFRKSEFISSFLFFFLAFCSLFYFY